MRRHITVLAELLERGGSNAVHELLLLTASWSGRPEPAARDAELSAAAPSASYQELRIERMPVVVRRDGDAKLSVDIDKTATGLVRDLKAVISH